MNPPEIVLSFTLDFVDSWLYEAVAYGREAADFGAEVRRDIETLPEVSDD